MAESMEYPQYEVFVDRGKSFHTEFHPLQLVANRLTAEFVKVDLGDKVKTGPSEIRPMTDQDKQLINNTKPEWNDIDF